MLDYKPSYYDLPKSEREKIDEKNKKEAINKTKESKPDLIEKSEIDDDKKN